MAKPQAPEALALSQYRSGPGLVQVVSHVDLLNSRSDIAELYAEAGYRFAEEYLTAGHHQLPEYNDNSIWENRR